MRRIIAKARGATIGGAAVLLSALALGQPSASAQQRIEESCWEPSFEDNFDTLSLWREEQTQGTWRTRYIWERNVRINNELQFYIDPELHGHTPFAINDGILSIIASRTPAELAAQVDGSRYVSGVLTTEKSFAQQYGRFEVVARMPVGRGLWSAFWLLPTFDRWPEGVAVLPEIDVVEYLGHEPEVFHTTLHTNQSGSLSSHPYQHDADTDLTQAFHRYSVVWDKQQVQWYFDGIRVANHPTPADFTRPVHFLLNLAVGGNWPGEPDSRTVFPARYQIDAVRAYTLRPQCQGTG